jgi:cellulose synthase/poly-beta-1,6-N-acetylglucosamine synthase-like glycosyltransferase
MSRVLAIVVAYQHPDYLNRCIDSLNHQTYEALDYVIWDNGGCEEVADRVASLGGHRRIYHKSEYNMLWTPAQNQAMMKYGTDNYEYFMTLNHDITLPVRCVENLVNAFKELPDHAGAVGPTGHGIGGQQGTGANRAYARSRVNFLIGACVMYKKEVYDVVGHFADDMPLSGDHVYHVSHLTRDSENWGIPAQQSWAAFNKKYDNYFLNEDEARMGLWNGPYNPDYPLGTGLSRMEKIKRGILRDSADSDNNEG